MTDFKQLVQSRRSHRKFTEEPVSQEDIRCILRAALMSPTSKGVRAWNFIVVEDKEMISALSKAKSMGGEFLKGAAVCIAVCGNPEENDCWIEDGSIAAISMQYQAEELGLGSCWAQMRARTLADGTPADVQIRSILSLPESLSCLCIIGLGHKADERKPQNEDRLKWEKVEYK